MLKLFQHLKSVFELIKCEFVFRWASNVSSFVTSEVYTLAPDARVSLYLKRIDRSVALTPCDVKAATNPQRFITPLWSSLQLHGAFQTLIAPSFVLMAHSLCDSASSCASSSCFQQSGCDKATVRYLPCTLSQTDKASKHSRAFESKMFLRCWRSREESEYWTLIHQMTRNVIPNGC